MKLDERAIKLGPTRREFLKAAATSAVGLGLLRLGWGSGAHGAPVGPRDLVLWHWETPPHRVTAYDRLLERFRQETGIVIRQVPIAFPEYHTKILTAAPARTLPDLIFVNPPQFMLLLSNDLAVPLDDMFAELHGKVRFFSPYRDYEFQGKQWGVPLFGVSWPLTYRRDLHLAAGFVGAPATWGDLLSRAEKMHGPDLPGFTLPISTKGNYGNQVVWGFLRTNGARIVVGAPGKEKVVFNSRETIETYKFLVELARFTGPGAETADWASTELLVRTGRVQTLIYTGSPIGDIADKNPDLARRYAQAPVPRPSREHKHANTGYARAAMITRDAQRRGTVAAAKEWLRWITQPENNAEFLLANPGLFMPVNHEVVKAKIWLGHPFNREYKPIVHALTEAMKHISVQGFEDGARSPKAAAIEGSFMTARVLQRIVLEKEPVEQAVAWGHREYEKILGS